MNSSDTRQGQKIDTPAVHQKTDPQIGNRISRSSKSTRNIPDSLLIALFRKPNDRMFITQLEQSIIRFINSENQTLNINPVNSYYRLISYQVADYHDLRHTVSRSKDSCNIVLFKGSMTQKMIDDPLLRELQEKNFDIGNISSVQNTPMNPQSDENVVESGNAPTPKPIRKFKILKREVLKTTDSKTDSNESPQKEETKEDSISPSNSSLPGPNVDLEMQRIQREREYEEAKQKIFNRDQKPVDFNESDDNAQEGEAYVSNDPTNDLWGPIEGARAIRRDDDTPQYVRQGPTRNEYYKGNIPVELTAKTNSYQSAQYPQLNGYPFAAYPVNNNFGGQQQSFPYQGTYIPPNNGYQYSSQMTYPNYQPGYYNPQQYGYQFNNDNSDIPPQGNQATSNKRSTYNDTNK